MTSSLSTSEVFLVAMLMIFSVPYLIWRLGRTEYWAPLVVVQIMAGILLGPGVLGAAFPHYYQFVFSAPVIQALNGISQWAVMVFVCIAGVELDVGKAWHHRQDSGITAALALGTPLAAGAAAAAGLMMFPGWVGSQGARWQFVLGVGMSCAVTALPILILLMGKLEILREPVGQRVLRYASLDDIAIWSVLALILLDGTRAGKQLGFLLAFALACMVQRKIMARLDEADRWHAALIWLAACGLGADWSGLHYMVGAFLAGASMDARWFNVQKMDALRDHVLLIAMPVFFLSTGLRTHWHVGGVAVFLAAAVLLAASIGGKLTGTLLAGKLLGWSRNESWLVGWLLQTKALIMIIFANVLLDKFIITAETFTALLLMAAGSTMLTVPMAGPWLLRLKTAPLGTGAAPRPAQQIR